MTHFLRTAAAALAISLALPALAEADGGYVLFTEGKQWATMNGSTAALRDARSARSGLEGLLYVRRDGQTLLIRDAMTLAQAQAILQPQGELGRRQGELGGRQGALGAKQAAVGAQQARLGLQQVSVSRQRAEELSRQQKALGRQQEELGRQQEALGRQQEALGREQERVTREAETKMAALIDTAVKRGLARRVD